MSDGIIIPVWVILIGLFLAPWILTRFQRGRAGASMYAQGFLTGSAARVGVILSVVLLVIGSAYYTIRSS